MFLTLNHQNSYLFSLHQKTLAEMLTASWRSYYNKKIRGAYASQVDLLKLYVFYGEMIDFQKKRHLVHVDHILTSDYWEKGLNWLFHE